jgi:hypothetical protein
MIFDFTKLLEHSRAHILARGRQANRRRQSVAQSRIERAIAELGKQGLKPTYRAIHTLTRCSHQTISRYFKATDKSCQAEALSCFCETTQNLPISTLKGL